MHILCSNAEFKANQSKLEKLPIGTTVVIGDDATGKSLCGLCLHKSGFEIEMDFVEHEREWKDDKEKNEFKESQTPESIIRFFVEHDEYKNPHPHRYWRAMSNKEREVFKYVRHDGSYIADGADPELGLKRPYNLFKITLSREANAADLKVAKSELLRVLEIQKEQHPEINWHHFRIFEHSLSAGGFYTLVCEGDQWKITLTRWGSTEPYFEGNGLDDCLKRIREYLWYGDDPVDYEDSEEDYY